MACPVLPGLAGGGWRLAGLPPVVPSRSRRRGHRADGGNRRWPLERVRVPDHAGHPRLEPDLGIHRVPVPAGGRAAARLVAPGAAPAAARPRGGGDAARGCAGPRGARPDHAAVRPGLPGQRQAVAQRRHLRRRDRAAARTRREHLRAAVRSVPGGISRHAGRRPRRRLRHQVRVGPRVSALLDASLELRRNEGARLRIGPRSLPVNRSRS